MAYLIDTDVFINAKNFHYRFDVCPGFWNWLIEANNRDVLFSIQQVRKEIMERKDMLSLWCGNKYRKKMFLETKDSKTYEELQLLATWVSQNYQMAAQNKFFKSADFVLVGFAAAHGHTVVTHEVAANGFEVKIPNACRHMEVPVINPFDMLGKEKVKFNLA